MHTRTSDNIISCQNTQKYGKKRISLCIQEIYTYKGNYVQKQYPSTVMYCPAE